MNKSSGADVLSPALRENFDTMRSLISQEKKRKDAPEAEDEQLQAKKLQVAVKTALAVEDEMSRLRNGIAELEELLVQQEGGGAEHIRAFPSLPPIVPDDEMMEDGRGEAAESSKLDGKMVHG